MFNNNQHTLKMSLFIASTLLLSIHFPMPFTLTITIALIQYTHHQHVYLQTRI